MNWLTSPSGIASITLLTAIRLSIEMPVSADMASISFMMSGSMPSILPSFRISSTLIPVSADNSLTALTCSKVMSSLPVRSWTTASPMTLIWESFGRLRRSLTGMKVTSSPTTTKTLLPAMPPTSPDSSAFAIRRSICSGEAPLCIVPSGPRTSPFLKVRADAWPTMARLSTAQRIRSFITCSFRCFRSKLRGLDTSADAI